MGNTEPDRERSMSDTTASTDTTDAAAASAATDTSTDTATDTGDAKDWAAEAAKWKALSRKHEDSAKANADKAKRLDELEAANATEIEKAQKVAEQAKADAAAARAELAIAQAAVKHGLSSDDLELLGSHGTAEEIDARAEKLAARLKAVAPPATASDFGAGDRGDDVKSGADQLTSADVSRLMAQGKHEEVVKARQEGRLNDVMGIKS